jgi:hypothetical protein
LIRWSLHIMQYAVVIPKSIHEDGSTKHSGFINRNSSIFT